VSEGTAFWLGLPSDWLYGEHRIRGRERVVSMLAVAATEACCDSVVCPDVERAHALRMAGRQGAGRPDPAV